MAKNQNGSRFATQEPPHNRTTAAKSTRSLDLSQCGPHCGACWETFCGDVPCCEAEYIGALRRDLTEALAGVSRG